MIGILGAMEEEVLAFKSHLKDIEETKLYDLVFIKGKLKDVDVILCKCGVGKVSSSRTTSLLIEKFHCTLVINIGICGGNPKYLKTRQILVGEKIMHADADLTTVPNRNYVFGQMSGCPIYFVSDKEYVDKIRNNPKIVIGNIASADTFLTDPNQFKEIQTKLNGFEIYGFDMESASIAQVCYLSKVKFLVIRYISDLIGLNDQLDEYEDVKENSSLILYDLISSIL